MHDFLEELPLSDDEKSKLAGLAVENPAALLAMLRAAPTAFSQLLSGVRLQILETALEKLLDESERAVVAESPPRYETGAIIGPHTPGLRAPRYDIAERDALFEQLKRLRQRDDASPETEQQIRDLEHRLTTMLEDS